MQFPTMARKRTSVLCKGHGNPSNASDKLFSRPWNACVTSEPQNPRCRWLRTTNLWWSLMRELRIFNIRGVVSCCCCFALFIYGVYGHFDCWAMASGLFRAPRYEGFSSTSTRHVSTENQSASIVRGACTPIAVLLACHVRCCRDDET